MSVARGVLVTLLFSCLIIGCSPKTSEIVVLQVGPDKVSLKEYEQFYMRNSGGWDVARQSSMEERKHFLDLLSNYKLKLLDAYDRHLMNDADIVRELKEYRGNLASTYMLNKELTEPAVQQLYDRRKEEIRASHILIKVGQEASPEDTLAAYNKAMDIIKQLRAGASFDSLSRVYSEDISSKINNGDLYYFTSGQMVSSFEKAAFAMHVGELSTVPARTPFGYHIIKITDRKPVTGSIKVRHIMARFKSTTPDAADTASALVRIKGIQDSLKKGWDFEKLAVKVSEDQGSSASGGDLGWFERRRWVLPFDEAAFKLHVGETSGIVRTPYGYHIIRCDSTKPLKPFDEIREDLKKLYQHNGYNEDYAAYIARLKKEYNFSFDEGVFNSLMARLDTTQSVGDSAWDSNIPADVRALPMMTIKGKSYTLDTVVSVLGKRPDFSKTPLRRRDLHPRVDLIAESFLVEEKTGDLELRFPEFAALMKEYDDGVVLYKAEQLEVWNKTAVSDTALRAYYEANKNKFMFPERINVSEIILDTDTLAAKLYDSLSHGANFADLANRYNEDPKLQKNGGSRGLMPIDTDDVSKKSVNLGVNEISEPFALEEGGFAIIKLTAREQARPKTYEEAGAEVSNAYQEYMSKQLEQNWLDRIRKKYPVTQYPEQLMKAFSTPEPTQ